MMNIFNNNQNYTLSQQTGNLSVLGNYNNLRIARSQMVITVNGNSNTFIIHNSTITFSLNGNLNVIRAVHSTLTYGFNGNQNTVQIDPNTTHTLQYCNGVGNQFPNSQNRANRGSRNQPPPQGNNFNRSNRRIPQQFNNFQYAYQQQEPGNFRPRHQNNYYPQSNRFNPFNMGFGPFGGGNFMEGFSQSMSNMFSSPMNRSPRNFQPNNQPYNFNFQMYEPEQEQRFQNDVYVEEQEERGLSTEELGILPRSKHEGKDGKCTICLCEITRGEQQTFLMCFHPFHTECIADWLKKSGKCPICQFNVKRHLRGEQ